MAQAIFGSPVRELKGEQVNCEDVGNTLGYAQVEPGFHEVILSCAEDIGVLLNPAIDYVLVYDGSTYTDYTAYAKEKATTHHVPLDAMNGANGALLYVGSSEPFGGLYFDIGTNVNDETVSWDVEYCNASDSFIDVSDDSDGTASPANTSMAQDGAYTWTVPSNWCRRSVGGYGGGDLFWIKFKSNAALANAVDINNLWTVNKGTDYGRLLKDEDHRFSLNTQKVGALQMGTLANTGDVNVTWVKH
jgi:hypothetical protein